MARKKLGEMLVEAGVLDPDALRSALGEQRRWGHPLGRTLVQMRLVSEEALVAVLAQQLATPTVDLDKLAIPKPVIDLVPAELARRYQLVPFAQQVKFLSVAMADPTNHGIIDELRIRTQLNIRQYLAGPQMIERAIATYYGGEAAIDLGINDAEMVDSTDERFRALDRADEPSDLLLGDGPPIRPRDTLRGAEIVALQARISALEALVERDEQVLRKVLVLLVDKGIATREDILERLNE